MEQTKKGLRPEIDSTLMFFVEMDLKIYGYVTEDTVRAFRNQNTELPEIVKVNLKTVEQ